MRFLMPVAALAIQMGAAAAPAQERPSHVAAEAVRMIARPVAGRLARFHAPVCVAVVGDAPNRDQRIKARLEARARTFGLTASAADCEPNLRIVVAPSAHEFVRHMLAIGSAPLKGLSAADEAALRAIAAPIIAWTSTGASQSSRALEPVRTGEVNENGLLGAHVTAQRVDSATLLPARTAQELSQAMIVIDRAVAEAKTPEQLADYAATRLLGNTTDAVPPFDSILRLFAGDWSSASGLTSFDLLFLQQLYASRATARAPALIDAIAAKITGAVGMVYDGKLLARAAPSVAAQPEKPQGLLDGGAATHDTDPAPDPAAATQPLDWGETITITASKAGPALWRVRKGEATIIILGTVAPMPPDLGWIDWRVRAALHRARRLLVNSDPETGYVLMRRWTPDAARKLYQPKGQSVFAELDAAEAAQLRKAAIAIGQSPDRYADLRPAAAAMLLNWDWRQRSHLTNLLPASVLVADARKHGLPVQMVTQTSLLTTIDELPALPADAQRRCFDRLLTTFDNERARAFDQAKAWARGDIKQLRNLYIPPANCAADMPADARRRDAAIAAWNAILVKTLERHDRTFAIIDIASLLRRDGILEWLHANGAEVDVPPDDGFAATEEGSRPAMPGN